MLSFNPKEIAQTLSKQVYTDWNTQCFLLEWIPICTLNMVFLCLVTNGLDIVTGEQEKKDLLESLGRLKDDFLLKKFEEESSSTADLYSGFEANSQTDLSAEVCISVTVYAYMYLYMYMQISFVERYSVPCCRLACEIRTKTLSVSNIQSIKLLTLAS